MQNIWSPPLPGTPPLNKCISHFICRSRRTKDVFWCLHSKGLSKNTGFIEARPLMLSTEWSHSSHQCGEHSRCFVNVGDFAIGRWGPFYYISLELNGECYLHPGLRQIAQAILNLTIDRWIDNRSCFQGMLRREWVKTGDKSRVMMFQLWCLPDQQQGAQDWMKSI